MKTKTIIIILLSSLILSCGLYNTKPAKQVVDNYFTELETNGTSGLLEFYSPVFFKVTPKEEWSAMLEYGHGLLGNHIESKLLGWEIETTDGPLGRGTYYTLNYHSEYSEYDAEETINLFKESDSDAILITGHHIESGAFE